MKKEGSPTQNRNSRPDIRIVTTDPNGESVERYREILEDRLKNHNPHHELNQDLEIEISQYTPTQIVKAVMYAGLQAQEEMRQKELLEFLGEDSDYALVINKAYGEMALFVDGESYPLRPKEAFNASEEIEEHYTQGKI